MYILYITTKNIPRAFWEMTLSNIQTFFYIFGHEGTQKHYIFTFYKPIIFSCLFEKLNNFLGGSKLHHFPDTYLKYGSRITIQVHILQTATLKTLSAGWCVFSCCKKMDSHYHRGWLLISEKLHNNNNWEDWNILFLIIWQGHPALTNQAEMNIKLNQSIIKHNHQNSI